MLENSKEVHLLLIPSSPLLDLGPLFEDSSETLGRVWVPLGFFVFPNLYHFFISQGHLETSSP